MAILGAVAALGLQPQGYWWLTLAALASAMVIPPAATRGRAALHWWLFAAGYFVVALRWLVEPFQVEAEIYGWMAPFALAFMAGGLALFWAIAGALAQYLGQTQPRYVLALIGTIGAAELLRAYIFTGFPWAGLAQVWVGTPLLQSLSVFGPQGLGLATLLFAAIPAFIIYNALRFWIPGLLGSGLVLFAVLRLGGGDTGTTDHIVRLVQPNAPQHEKWDPEKAREFFWRQIEATAAAPRPDLIIWPETAIPTLLHLADEALFHVQTAAQGAPVVLGMQRQEMDKVFNAALVLDPDGTVTQLYDKHHLVPFGEFVPFAATMAKLGIGGLAVQQGIGYTPGSGPKLLDLGALGKALPLICYEAVFPQHAYVPNARPDFLLQITNDAWFGTYAGPQQHLAQARMRAVEQGLPMIRVANTGISAVIDAGGNITASMPLGVHGHVDAALPAPGAPTLYSVTGDWLAGSVTICILLGGWWCGRREQTRDA